MTSKWVKGSAISLVLILLGASGVSLLAKGESEYPAGTPGAAVSISVQAGESGAAIARELGARGVILTSKNFYALATRDPRALAIAPGRHLIESHITSKQALIELLDSSRNSGIVQIIEGSSFSDVLALLRKSGVKGEVGKVGAPIFSHSPSLEGFLFPATYAFAEGTSTNSALSQMVIKFSQSTSSIALSAGFEKYTAYDVLTIASLIQIEADSVDYAKAARVIYNRLKIGMPLQLNSTVQFANGTRGHIALSRSQLGARSPYNTYLHTGLTPTPISNPGLAAMRAALNPASGDWLYFITVKPHETRFTKSYTEFEGWVTLYNNNLANGAFK